MKNIDKFLFGAAMAFAVLLASQPGQAQLLGEGKGTVKAGPLGAATGAGLKVQTPLSGGATGAARTRGGASMGAEGSAALSAETRATVTATTAAETPPAQQRATTTTRVREKTAAETGTRLFNLMDFDVNGDKVLSTPEVGEKLFAMYDTDGNMVIDNNEYERKSVLTVVPVARDVTISADFDGDGAADSRAQSSETFLRHTQLARFDAGGDGLSPREFMARSFAKADVNGDKSIDLREWRASYDAGIAAEVEQKARFNN